VLSFEEGSALLPLKRFDCASGDFAIDVAGSLAGVSQNIRPTWPRLVQHFAFSPSSISRRMASERVVSFLAAQSSMAATISFGTRTGKFGSRPPLGGRPRPVFFGDTVIDFPIIW
jgi:hypothetical protein